MDHDSQWNPDCAKCGKFYGSPDKGLCTYCYDTWRRARGLPVREDGGAFVLPASDRAVAAVLAGGVSCCEPMRIPETMIGQLKTLLKNHACTPLHFLGTLRDFGVVDEVDLRTPSKLFTAEQATELLNERSHAVHDEEKAWVWQHVVCFLVADYWNIPVEFRVGHCYYADWGTPPKYGGNIGECRAQMIERVLGRAGFALHQIPSYA